MASIVPRKDKSGNVVSYRIRVFRGYDEKGVKLKPFEKTYKPATGMTEKQIQKSLNELDFPCTKIIIAQRISTTKTADKILILKDGCIAEQGTHAELIAAGGYYSELVKLQTGESI